MSDETSYLFTQNDYEIVKRDVLYDGVFRMSRYQLRFRLFNGGWSQRIMRELVERKSAVAILPYDPILDHVVLIEQFRIGALANPQSPWLIEAVAGLVDTNQTPGEIVIREATE